jgi:hypothetical protein
MYGRVKSQAELEMPDRSDLFCSAARRAPAVVLREEERFGKMDARSGLGLWNLYSRKLSGDRLAAYEIGFREERARAEP